MGGGVKNFEFCFLPLGDQSIASSRLRCFSIHNALIKAGFSSKIGFSEKCKILIIQKRTDTLALKAAIKCQKDGGILIFDIDDFPESEKFRKKAQLLASLATAITCATPEQKKIAEYLFVDVEKSRIFCFPNPVDYELERPINREHSNVGPLKVGWFGNVENFPNRLVNELSEVSGVELHAITNFSQEMVDKFKDCTFHKWSYCNFSSILCSLDVCILSHFGTEIYNAKNANKMITAISHGLPVIASDTPDYRRLAKACGVDEYLFLDYEKLVECVNKMRDPDCRMRYIQKAQPVIWKEFNLDTILKSFLNIIEKSTKSGPQKGGSRTAEFFRGCYQRWVFKRYS